MIQRVWQQHEVQPHRVEKYKLSRDPRFEEKVRDIVGLYLNAPERAVVYQWLANWNTEPKAFVWTATADVTLGKVRRCKELAESAH